MSEPFGAARQLADAVLYEGYVLYPYRASAGKNQVRWQFGVVAPRAWREQGGCEEAWMQTECLIEPGARPALTGMVRCLQIQRRTVEELADESGEKFRAVDSIEMDGAMWTAWDEGVEREIELPAAELRPGDVRTVPFLIEGGRDIEPVVARSGRLVGRVVRERQALRGEIHLAVEQAAEARHPLLRLRVRVDNLSRAPAIHDGRNEAMRSSLVGTHMLLAVSDGAFLSLTDPPEWARPAVAACSNVRCWPVLTGSEGERAVVLASPIILQDHARIAPESPADFYDATEIDELLALRTLTLTDQEKREARATDARAAAIVDRVDAMSAEMMGQLHGAVRERRAIALPELPWWDPAADASVAPETDSVSVGGVAVARGSRVRLRPGSRRADAQDMFLIGRIARVEGVFLDVEDRHYVAVTLDDDPGADLHAAHGRYFYFQPDEIEPVADES